MWHPDHLSFRDHTGVLLQHARIRLFVPQFITCIRGTRIVVTLNLISEVLHIPRIEFADYTGSEHLRIVSKDELSSRFCDPPSS